jgi:hypothetical protein
LQGERSRVEELTCEERGRKAETAAESRRWRALHADDSQNAGDQAVIVAVYCPECADREFPEDEWS